MDNDYRDPDEDRLPAELSKRLEMARLDHIYGVDGNKPCRQVDRLARKYELSTLVVVRHQKVWAVEIEAFARTNSKVYGNAADPDVIIDHEEDITFMRKQLVRFQEALDKGIPGTEAYENLFKYYLVLQRRCSELTGAEGAVKNSLSLQRLAGALAIKKQMEDTLPEGDDKPQARKISEKIFELGDISVPEESDD
jgi:hypothetical protein